MPKIIYKIFLLPLFLIIAWPAGAQDFSAVDFKVIDPVLFPASFSESDNFRLFSTISQISIGESSITDFGVNAGFLYFPLVIPPVLSVLDIGSGKVTLTWTAAQGFLGLNVSNYSIGQSVVSGTASSNQSVGRTVIFTVPGGPYTYQSAGNVTSFTVTGLTNGVTSFFVVRAEDAQGDAIATSNEVSAKPTLLGDGGLVTTPPTPPLFGGPIIGEPIRVPFCGRSDLNCDGHVNLQDFSILLTRPKVSTNQILSYMFFDWTDRLPIPVQIDERRLVGTSGGTRIFSEPQEFAQFVEVVRLEPQREPEQPKISIFRSIWIAIKNFIVNLWE